jgi:MSHA biogenesis protein MshK
VTNRRTPLLHCVGLLLAGAAHFPACAEPLADPTRPPGYAPGAVAPTHAASAAAAPAWPQLRSVRISAPGDSSALLDGRVVRVGERLGDATVVAIDAQGVQLRRGAVEQRVTLLPGAAKTIANGPSPVIRSAATAATRGQP